MYPVIFKLSFVEVRSYYVLWAFALFMLMIWTRRRAEKIYGLDDADVAAVMLWVYCAGIAGSFVPGIIERLPLYMEGRIAFGELFRGLYSSGGLLAGGLFGLWKIYKLGLSADVFADAVSIPLAAMLCVGRIGCFLEGCCVGIGRYYRGNVPWWAVHFPFDAAGFCRFPSQLLESSVTFLIFIFLSAASRFIPREAIKRGGILFPFMLIFYGLYRIFSDHYRQLYADGLMKTSRYIWEAGVVLGACWLFYTIFRMTHSNSLKRTR